MSAELQVLVVEDNQNSRELLSEMLTVLGHAVESVTSAEDALGVLGRRNFDVLMSDINLPGMSGIELAETALADAPEMKVIFASGFGYLVADKTEFDFILLHKPYSFAQLQHALATVFAEKA
jgi:CheY-like chemotaxis protein